MDFVEWCSHVLKKAIEASDWPEAMDADGIPETLLARSLFGAAFPHYATTYEESPHERKAMLAAAWALCEVGALESPGALSDPRVFMRLTYQGRALDADPVSLWSQICAVPLQPLEEELLRTVNRLVQPPGDPLLPQMVDAEVVAARLGWEPGLAKVLQVARQLHDRGLIFRQDYPGPDMTLRANLHATYRGLVWETRRGLTLESQFIDNLVIEWETTSVEFKGEQHTDTAGQKAELVKDLLGLANTQASGRRWLIIGFDDKTREYTGPPDPKLTQNHLEQLLARYTDPPVTIRYEVVDYRAGPVGKLEVLRDAAKLPYSVAKSIGEKKRILEGQIFVRHGSQTEEPTPLELQAIRDEAQRAKDRLS